MWLLPTGVTLHEEGSVSAPGLLSRFIEEQVSVGNIYYYESVPQCVPFYSPMIMSSVAAVTVLTKLVPLHSYFPESDDWTSLMTRVLKPNLFCCTEKRLFASSWSNTSSFLQVNCGRSIPFIVEALHRRLTVLPADKLRLVGGAWFNSAGTEFDLRIIV